MTRPRQHLLDRILPWRRRAYAHGWMLIVERDAATEPADTHGYIDTPGTGRCRRSDGRTGSLVHMVPPGWQLVDVLLAIPTGRERCDRIYLLRRADRRAMVETYLGRRWTRTNSGVLDGRDYLT